MEVYSKPTRQYRIRHPLPRHDLLDRLSDVQYEDMVLQYFCDRMHL